MSLLFSFIIGYSFLVLTNITEIQIPLDPLIIVSGVYFFGAVFTIVIILTVRNMLTSILGKEISNREAEKLFREYTNHKNSDINIAKQYSILCEYCDKKIRYTLADVVRSNVTALDRGISVEDIFGTKSFILRPTHLCADGRREYNIVHDKDLDIRSIEDSRIIYGGNL